MQGRSLPRSVGCLACRTLAARGAQSPHARTAPPAIPPPSRPLPHPCAPPPTTTAAEIYGGSRQDIQFRCALLTKAALEAPWVVPCGGATYGEDNLVFVANDWHTSLLPFYLQARARGRAAASWARRRLRPPRRSAAAPPVHAPDLPATRQPT